MDQIKQIKEKLLVHADLVDAAVENINENGPVVNAWDELNAVMQQENEDQAIEGESEYPEHNILDLHNLPEEPDFHVPSNPNDIGDIGGSTTVQVLHNVIPLWPDDEYFKCIRSLNYQQRQVFQIVLDWCNSVMQGNKTKVKPDPLHMFITGGAGTGKSFLIKALYQMIQITLRKEGDDPTMIKTLLMAPTGMAAFNIEGQTIHSSLLLNLGQKRNNSHSRLSDEQRNTLRCKLRDLQIIIIDEISMVGADTLLEIHRRLDELFHSSFDFGCISILAFGDLYQLPPVGQSFVFEKPSDKYLQCAGITLWDNFSFFEITEIMMQKDDKLFAELLNRVRTSTHTKTDIETLKIVVLRKYHLRMISTNHSKYLLGMKMSISTTMRC